MILLSFNLSYHPLIIIIIIITIIIIIIVIIVIDNLDHFCNTLVDKILYILYLMIDLYHLQVFIRLLYRNPFLILDRL